MAVVKLDKPFTESIKKMLEAVRQPRTPEELARTLGEPVNDVHNSLFEMLQSGLVAVFRGTYVITEKGKKLV
ncbi:MAG: hypothetical protein D6743_02975 [Calditrichaeota bacterium]|nr:MAG: hypothetical protein D6743_02975 [Calditrichota bacterium]